MPSSTQATGFKGMSNSSIGVLPQREHHIGYHIHTFNSYNQERPPKDQARCEIGAQEGFHKTTSSNEGASYHVVRSKLDSRSIRC